MTAVRGYCPACASPLLFVTDTGIITYKASKCPSPEAAADVLESPETAHILRVRDHDPYANTPEYVIEHPLIGRLQGADECVVITEYIKQAHAFRGPINPGVYRIVRHASGKLHITELEAAK